APPSAALATNVGSGLLLGACPVIALSDFTGAGAAVGCCPANASDAMPNTTVPARTALYMNNLLQVSQETRGRKGGAMDVSPYASERCGAYALEWLRSCPASAWAEATEDTSAGPDHLSNDKPVMIDATSARSVAASRITAMIM